MKLKGVIFTHLYVDPKRELTQSWIQTITIPSLKTIGSGLCKTLQISTFPPKSQMGVVSFHKWFIVFFNSPKLYLVSFLNLLKGVRQIAALEHVLKRVSQISIIYKFQNFGVVSLIEKEFVRNMSWNKEVFKKTRPVKWIVAIKRKKEWKKVTQS